MFSCFLTSTVTVAIRLFSTFSFYNCSPPSLLLCSVYFFATLLMRVIPWCRAVFPWLYLQARRLWEMYTWASERFFPGGGKMVKFVFFHSKLRKQPFLRKISRSRAGPRPPLPPFRHPWKYTYKYVFASS